jgi:hypothetical protein
MALNFPSAPVVGQVYQAEGVTFVWNGTLWVVLSPASATFATKAEAEAGVRDDRLLSPLRAKEAIAALAPAPPGFNPGVALCRAWCLFNGVANSLLQGFNVSAAANEGAGFFRVYFQTPLPDANYIVLANARGRTTGNHPAFAASLSQTVPNSPENFRVNTGTTGGVNSTGFNENSELVHVSVWS